MDIINIYNNFNYNQYSQAIEGYDIVDIKNIRKQIESFSVVLLKNVFNKEHCLDIRNSAFEYFIKNKSENLPITRDVKNFFRQDDNPQMVAVRRIQQFYNSFYWNTGLSYERGFLRSMSILRNEIAKLPTQYATNTIEDDGFITQSVIAQYPLGGGYLSKHQDPLNKQFCVIIGALSRKGDDFHEGGLYVELNNKRTYLDDSIDVGDVYLMNPSSIHGVAPVEKTTPPKWQENTGRWILFPSLVELKTLYGNKVDGLVDLKEK